MRTTEFLIVGAGIAGASAAYFLAPHARCILLERESQPGYHSTGRSAAQFIATYGPPHVRALTRASEPFFDQPPQGFAQAPLLTPRGLMTVGRHEHKASLDLAWETLQQISPRGQRLTASEVLQWVPVLRPDGLLGAIFEPDSFDMDVHAIHQGFLRGFKQAGGTLCVNADVNEIERCPAGWRVYTRAQGVFETAVLINASGAWCDEVARMAGVKPVGLVPKRRTAMTFLPPSGIDTGHWPLVMAADECFYMKPDAGALLASPVNEDETHPQDVQPEELDIALTLDALETWTTLSPRPTHTWAGLRSFVKDGELLAGYDLRAAGFFWCAGQGGYGIQTSAAMGEACAALALGRPIPAPLQDVGVDGDRLGLQRFT